MNKIVNGRNFRQVMDSSAFARNHSRVWVLLLILAAVKESLIEDEVSVPTMGKIRDAHIRFTCGQYDEKYGDYDPWSNGMLSVDVFMGDSFNKYTFAVPGLKPALLDYKSYDELIIDAYNKVKNTNPEWNCNGI